MGQENKGHRIGLNEREAMEATGVVNVESFDDQKIILETVQGMLTLQGENLHIKSLNLEEGNIKVEGRVDSIAYSEVSKGMKDRGKGFIERLLR